MKTLLLPFVLFAATAAYASDIDQKKQDDEGRNQLNKNVRGTRHRRNEDEFPPEKLPPVEDSALQEQIDGEKPNYIIVYKDSDVASAAITEQATLDIVEKVGGVVKHEYKTVLKGMTASLTKDAVEELKRNEGIKYVVKDEVVSVSQDVSWGLDRVDQRNLPLDGSYRFSRNINAGAGIDVCVSIIKVSQFMHYESANSPKFFSLAWLQSSSHHRSLTLGLTKTT